MKSMFINGSMTEKINLSYLILLAKEVTYDKTLFEAEAKVLLGNYNDLIKREITGLMKRLY